MDHEAGLQYKRRYISCAAPLFRTTAKTHQLLRMLGFEHAASKLIETEQ
jgi:hypothetical protein